MGNHLLKLGHASSKDRSFQDDTFVRYSKDLDQNVTELKCVFHQLGKPFLLNGVSMPETSAVANTLDGSASRWPFICSMTAVASAHLLAQHYHSNYNNNGNYHGGQHQKYDYDHVCLHTGGNRT